MNLFTACLLKNNEKLKKNKQKTRTQQVSLEGWSSARADVISRVRQGTVMGPLLFHTFINDLPEYTSLDVRWFADDSPLSENQLHS